MSDEIACSIRLGYLTTSIFRFSRLYSLGVYNVCGNLMTRIRSIMSRRAQPGRMNQCHRCGSGRHFYTGCTNSIDSCGKEEDTEVADTEVSCNFNRGYDCIVTLAQQGKISLSPNLILLDSCSMCSVCNDSSLLHNVLIRFWYSGSMSVRTYVHTHTREG